jgi:hypothetical protein
MVVWVPTLADIARVVGSFIDADGAGGVACRLGGPHWNFVAPGDDLGPRIPCMAA